MSIADSRCFTSKILRVKTMSTDIGIVEIVGSNQQKV